MNGTVGCPRATCQAAKDDGSAQGERPFTIKKGGEQGSFGPGTAAPEIRATGARPGISLLLTIRSRTRTARMPAMQPFGGGRLLRFAGARGSLDPASRITKPDAKSAEPSVSYVSAIGLMSGTSYDGVDVALINTDGENIGRLGPTGYRPYEDSERAVLRRAIASAANLTDRNARPDVLAEAEAVVTGA